MVTRVVTNSEWGHYELAEDLTGHHHHLICTNCGVVKDVELPDSLERSITTALGELAERTGFQIDDHRLDLVGRCGACR